MCNCPVHEFLEVPETESATSVIGQLICISSHKPINNDQGKHWAINSFANLH